MPQATAADFNSLTKDALTAALAEATNKLGRMANTADRLYRENQVVVDTALEYFGAVVVGPLFAMGTGFLETRYPNKDGTPMSLGPLPLPLVVAGFASLASAFSPPMIRKQLTYVTAANVGLWGGSMGRGYGVTRRAKALAKGGEQTAGEVGFAAPQALATAEGNAHDPAMIGAEDGWSDEELALLRGSSAA